VRKGKVRVRGILRKAEKQEKPCLEKTTPYIEDESAEKAYNDIISKYNRELLGKKIGEILGAASLNDILPKSILEEKIEELLKFLIISNVLIFMMVPLQFCLSNYYNATLYGDGTVPEEEFKAIPITIEKLNHLHELTRSLISLSLQTSQQA